MDAANWIHTTLSGDSQIQALVSNRIYRDEAPESAAFPFIAFQFISSVPVHNAFSDRLMDGELWQVKAVDKSGAYTKVNQIAARVWALMHKARGSNVVSSVLELKLPRTEKDANGQVYKSIILDFRVHTQ